MRDPNMLAMACPSCGKRAFDTNALPAPTVTIKMKCPQCGILVSIPLVSDSVLYKPPHASDGGKPLRLAPAWHEQRRWSRKSGHD